MRIMHVISTPASGGAEVYVKDLSLAMVAAGHSVHITFLETAAQCGRDLEYEHRFLSQLSAGNVSYSFLGIETRRRPWRGVTRLRREVTRFAPDVVHCHLYYALMFAFGLPRQLPVMMTVHSIELGAPAWMFRLFDRRVTAYVGICRACTDKLAPIAARPVVQIDNAVSGARLKASGWREANQQAPVQLAAIGRLTDAKQYPLMLESCARLKAQGLAFTLRIAGEGPHKAQLMAQIEALGLTDEVSLLGNISDVAGLLASADAFIMSSAWEGLPISLLEATLSGLPVLVTDVGGCAEVVHRVGNGLVVDQHTPERYAEALGRLVGDAELRRAFARNARRYGASYHIDTALSGHLALYGSHQPAQDTSGLEVTP
ncbi:glycosyltransferase [Cobetia sp. UIB-001]